jgi:ribosomal protein S15P/S13E
MNFKKKNFTLKGTPKEQAYQLVDAVKNHKVSVRKLKEIVPVTKEFVQGLVDCLKKEIDNEHTENKVVLETIIKNIENLQSHLRDQAIDKEERQSIRDLINQQLQMLSDIHNKNSERRNSVLLSILALIGTIFMAWKGHNRGNFPSSNNNHTI